MEFYNPYRKEEHIFRILSGPGYYDQPEGKDPVGKLWGINKYAIASALFFGTTDAVVLSQAKNIAETANILGYYFVPFMGLASAFAGVTYIATDLRGKDDKWNYAAGAVSCMPILWAWKKTTSFTLWGTALLMFAALAKKDSIQCDWKFFNWHDHYEYGNYKYDMSIVKSEWPRRPY
ncbi:uncharacterized protein LOC130666952 [Microplitis mediator]|uniref:uncharacterized protein LOC130666952 n=1 Tax=Microplitis mediator TaxID=375433 RepID=UPI002556F8F8|nr:uncharacterized protein LOC130666952 [Microplitis mediator]